MRRGLTLLDLLVALGVLALLVYVARLDWSRQRGEPAPATPTTQPVG